VPCKGLQSTSQLYIKKPINTTNLIAFATKFWYWDFSFTWVRLASSLSFLDEIYDSVGAINLCQENGTLIQLWNELLSYCRQRANLLLSVEILIRSGTISGASGFSISIRFSLDLVFFQIGYEFKTSTGTTIWWLFAFHLQIHFQSVYFLSILWYNLSGDDAQEDSAKFGYKQNNEIKVFQTSISIFG